MFSLVTKHNDPNAPLGWGERIGYGTGGFAFNMINGIIGSFLTIYLTSTIGLNAGIIASIIAVSKVFDGISDLIVGRMVDRTKSKLGKGRVWLAYMCIPFAVTTMLLFYVPQNMPEMAQYVYIFLMYNIVNAVCLTGLLVPYYSMVSLITANPYERGFLGNVQQIFQTLGNVFTGWTLVPLLGIFTSSTETLYTQRGFTITMLIYCSIMVVVSLFCVFSTKERVTDIEPEEKKNNVKTKKDNGNVMQTVKALLTNKYWVILALSNFAVFFVCIMFSMGNAGVSATQKLGLGLGTAVFGWVIDAAGFDGSLDAQGLHQAQSVSTAVDFLYSWLPLIMVGVIFIFMLLFYHCERDLKKMQIEKA